ncbi:MAG: type II toxin-antitoxin system VapC family toxin [Spirochaetota bacterium]|nr:type II toxin-antitoxin system VapC family toxin [Spirochaetota bacterium]
MTVLLDTHTFLWWIDNNDKLSHTARRVIGDSNNKIYLSAVSTWEIAIKDQLGKLTAPKPLLPFFTDQIQNNNFLFLPIQIEHTCKVNELENLHKDPFDRLLIGQSITEGFPILTIDPLISAYKDVKTIW